MYFAGLHCAFLLHTERHLLNYCETPLYILPICRSDVPVLRTLSIIVVLSTTPMSATLHVGLPPLLCICSSSLHFALLYFCLHFFLQFVIFDEFNICSIYAIYLECEH